MLWQHGGYAHARGLSRLNKHSILTAHPDPTLADEIVVFCCSNPGPFKRSAGLSDGVHTGKVAGPEVITDSGSDLADLVNDRGSSCFSQDDGVACVFCDTFDACGDSVQSVQTELAMCDISAIGAASTCAMNVFFEGGAFAHIADSTSADQQLAQRDRLAATIESPPVVADLASFAEVIDCDFGKDRSVVVSPAVGDVYYRDKLCALAAGRAKRQASRTDFVYSTVAVGTRFVATLASRFCLAAAFRQDSLEALQSCLFVTGQHEAL